MSYAGDRLIHDADSHLMELPDFLSANADPGLHDRLPRLETTGAFDLTAYAGRPGHTPVDFLQHLRQCPIVLTYLDGGKHYERAMRRKNCESGFRPAGEGPECGLDH